MLSHEAHFVQCILLNCGKKKKAPQ